MKEPDERTETHTNLRSLTLKRLLNITLKAKRKLKKNNTPTESKLLARLTIFSLGLVSHAFARSWFAAPWANLPNYRTPNSTQPSAVSKTVDTCSLLAKLPQVRSTALFCC